MACTSRRRGLPKKTPGGVVRDKRRTRSLANYCSAWNTRTLATNHPPPERVHGRRETARETRSFACLLTRLPWTRRSQEKGRCLGERARRTAVPQRAAARSVTIRRRVERLSEEEESLSVTHSSAPVVSLLLFPVPPEGMSVQPDRVFNGRRSRHLATADKRSILSKSGPGDWFYFDSCTKHSVALSPPVRRQCYTSFFLYDILYDLGEKISFLQKLHDMCNQNGKCTTSTKGLHDGTSQFDHCWNLDPQLFGSYEGGETQIFQSCDPALDNSQLSPASGGDRYNKHTWTSP